MGGGKGVRRIGWPTQYENPSFEFVGEGAMYAYFKINISISIKDKHYSTTKTKLVKQKKTTLKPQQIVV